MDSKTVYWDLLKSFLGLNYKWGGDDPIAGLDCSGLVIESHKAMGLVPRDFDTTAQGLREKYPKVTDPQFGDLAFYGGDHATHVVIVLNALLMIEAGGGGSKTVDAKTAAEQNAYIRIRPIKARKDLLGFGRPPLPWHS